MERDVTAHQLELVRPTRELDLDAAGIIMRNASWETAEALAQPTQLLVVDPPWSFSQRFGKGTPYAGMSTGEIKEAIDTMCQWPTGAFRLLLWTSWAIIPELWGWTPKGMKLKTGGAWVKSGPEDTGHYGQGYHWGGCSEPILLYTRGTPPNSREKLRNAWISSPSGHSVKPKRWSTQQIRRWTTPGGLVWEPFMGSSQYAGACLREGRRYLGTEADPDTFARTKEGGWLDESMG
jgi:hypothetical protein